jgi:hypothetical protein
MALLMNQLLKDRVQKANGRVEYQYLGGIWHSSGNGQTLLPVSLAIS